MVVDRDRQRSRDSWYVPTDHQHDAELSHRMRERQHQPLDEGQIALDDRTEVLLEEARKVNPEAQPGDMVVVETTPADFGRVAAQTAKQVILQRLREAEREIV
jgi:hypothetical protein